MFAGGIADKLGNRYEAKWLVRQFLDVIDGKADWIRFEGIDADFTGFEFAVCVASKVNWHQTKVSSPNGNWTIAALNREGVLSAFRKRFELNDHDWCTFVSQEPAKDLSDLASKSKIATSAEQFQRSLGNTHNNAFQQLLKLWKVDAATAYSWLNRSDFRTIPQPEIEAQIAIHADHLFSGASSIDFALLRDFLESRFNKKITTDNGRAQIRVEGKLTFKDWSLDPTLRERLKKETGSHLPGWCWCARSRVRPRA